MIDIRLKVFRSVALNLSFTKAAKELFISQPAISKHIQELEQEYNTRLFDRMGNRISLTHAGLLLLKHCDTIIRAYRKLDFDMGELNKKYKGELRIGASTTLSQYVMPEILAAFIQTHPDLSVTMLSGNSNDVITALEKGKIDFGMVEGLVRQPQYKYTHFMNDELVVVVRSNSPLANHEELTLDEFRQVPLVLREHGSGTLDVIEKGLHTHGLSLTDMNVIMHFGTTEGIKHFVKHSNTAGIVSIRSVHQELLHGDFKLIEVTELPLQRPFVFVEKRGESVGLNDMLKSFITKSYGL